MQFLLYGLIVIAGVMNPLQAACTGALNKALDRPFMVGVVNVAVTAVLTVAGAILLGQFGFQGKAAQAPWWAWLGGVAGAIFLVTQPIAAPKVGAGPFIAITVTAALIVSVIIDNFGWLGFEQHAATFWRIAGAGLMVAGVTLVAIF